MPRVKKCAICKKELNMKWSSLKKYCSYDCARVGAKKLLKKKQRIEGGSTKTLKVKLWELCKLIVRKRDKHLCQKCHKYVDGMAADTSHILGKGAYPALKYELRNLKVLCTHCHKNWWHETPGESGKWYRETFPDNWAYLESIRERKSNFKRYHYIEMIEEYKKILEEL